MPGSWPNWCEINGRPARTIGPGGGVLIPQNIVAAKEIEMKGTFRFHAEFGIAVDLINWRRVNLKPLLP